MEGIDVRKHGPISSFFHDDVATIVHALTGGFISIPFGWNTKPTNPIQFGIKSGESPNWLWTTSCDPDDYSLESAGKQVLLAAVDLAGPGVTHDAEGQMVIDERDDAGYQVSASPAVRTGIKFDIALKCRGEIVDSVSAWATAGSDGWNWGVELAGLRGEAENENRVVDCIIDAVSSWWITVGHTIVLEDGKGGQPPTTEVVGLSKAHDGGREITR